MSPVYMLDTNISSAAIRGNPQVSAKLDALPQTAWCVSAVTVAEHIYGITKRPQATTLAKLVRAFVQVAQVLPWDQAAAEQQGELRADLESKGTPIHEYDLLIAAHTLSEQLILVSNNVKHFQRVPGLVVEDWLR